jgi:uncharacterized membrane protein YphA (DoxX/SURF4 family)
MALHGVAILRISLGVVFLWFGALKLIPGLSPAEDLIRGSIQFVDPDLILLVVAIWEMVIGIGLLIGRYLRVTLLLLILQMGGAALPLLIMPDVVWTIFPFGLSLEGQYIFKNMVIIGSAVVIGGTVRGGYLVAEPTSHSVSEDRFSSAHADKA